MSFIDKIKIINKTDIDSLKSLYEQLIRENSKDKDIIDYYFYNLKDYTYENTYNKIIRNDDEFRKEIINKYKTCAITNKPLYMCEVAHIYPFAECSDKEKYDPNNGILLCADLHKLFDNFYMKIEPETQIITFADCILDDDNLEEYHKYHNTVINKSISKYYLNKKYAKL